MMKAIKMLEVIIEMAMETRKLRISGEISEDSRNIIKKCLRRMRTFIYSYFTFLFLFMVALFLGSIGLIIGPLGPYLDKMPFLVMVSQFMSVFIPTILLALITDSFIMRLIFHFNRKVVLDLERAVLLTPLRYVFLQHFIPERRI